MSQARHGFAGFLRGFDRVKGLFTPIKKFVDFGTWKIKLVQKSCYVTSQNVTEDQLHLHKNRSSFSLVIPAFCTHFGRIRSGLRRKSPLACACAPRGYFRRERCIWRRVNGSTARELFPCAHPLTPSMWLDRPFLPQVPFFQLFGVTRPGIKPSLPTVVTCVQPALPLAGRFQFTLQ